MTNKMDIKLKIFTPKEGDSKYTIRLKKSFSFCDILNMSYRDIVDYKSSFYVLNTFAPNIEELAKHD